MLTTKQVSADLRKSLGILAEHGILRYSSGAEIHVPAGLDFTVRATRTGVNITIEDRGWRESASASEADDADGWREEAARIRAEVDKIRGLYTPSLPGKTEWGPIFTTTRTTTSRDGSALSAADHYDPPLYCDVCRTEILRGESKVEEAGRTPGRIDVICISCHSHEITSGQSA